MLGKHSTERSIVLPRLAYRRVSAVKPVEPRRLLIEA
jgi:hypothetical protein